MNTGLECIPCLVRQTLEAAQLVSSDPVFHEMVLRETIAKIATLPYDQSPPRIAMAVHRDIRRRLNDPDPYREQKAHFNAIALSLRDQLRREINASTDPIVRAIHIAIAGNVIDFGVTSTIDEHDLHTAIEQTASQPLYGPVAQLLAHIKRARRILYLADNTGEIVLDRLLIERLPAGRVTVVVRGAPIMNDATVEDARYAGIEEVAPVISNGAAVPGTEIDLCSDEFRDQLHASDLVIAKGQGNYESLSDHPSLPIFHLFRVKCAVIERACGYALGSHVVVAGPAVRTEC